MRFLPITILAAALVACTPDTEIENVTAQNAGLQNSPILPTPPNGPIEANTAEKFCYWNDKKYSDGAQVCEAKRRYKCWTDKWVDIGNC